VCLFFIYLLVICLTVPFRRLILYSAKWKGDELERFGGKWSWPNFRVLQQHPSWGTEENYEKLVSRLRFKYGTSWIRSRSTLHSLVVWYISSMFLQMLVVAPRDTTRKLNIYIYIYCNVLGGSIHDGTLLHSKSQYTTVRHSQQLFEHTYTSDPHGLITLTPIEFFQQDHLWQSSNTHSHSYSQKASKHTSGQCIVGLSVDLHTRTASQGIVHH
jgi:hypothetical protein